MFKKLRNQTPKKSDGKQVALEVDLEEKVASLEVKLTHVQDTNTNLSDQVARLQTALLAEKEKTQVAEVALQESQTKSVRFKEEKMQFNQSQEQKELQQVYTFFPPSFFHKHSITRTLHCCSFGKKYRN
jgi:hypothetical protein